MNNLNELKSSELIEEISRRFKEREETINEIDNTMKDMEELNKQLLKSEENKSKFMSIIKNEFNNPLFSMISLTKSLLKNQEDERTKEIGSSLQQEALALNFQIKNIIMGTEIESGTLDLQNSTIYFEEIIEQILEELKYTIENKEIEIKINISSENDFYSDREKLYLILLNVVSNAIEYSPIEAKVEIDILEGIEDFRMVVKDQGEGIPEEEKEHIFQRFYQSNIGSNRESRGQGLGLSIVKDLIDFMDGGIKFNSIKDKYTVFEINLPKLEKEDSLFDDDDFLFDDEESTEF
jgi:signal transduction histidine kinase